MPQVFDKCTIECYEEKSLTTELAFKVGTHKGTTKSLRLVPATGPGNQVPLCEQPILVKKCSRRDQNLVPARPTCLNSVLGVLIGVVFLRFRTSNIGHWRKNFIEIANDKHC